MKERELINNFDALCDKVKVYNNNEKDLNLLLKAYLYAYEKHFGEKRLTNDDYILHPLNVAYILTSLSADIATLCAALLHDDDGNGEENKEELEAKFGKEITNLVVGVNKINRLSFNGDTEAVIATHRKIIVGLSEDVRVIIIKLADRLHNLLTLWVLPEARQREKAKETLDILVPIANRLGIQSLKSELEDLSLRYYKPDIYYSIVERLNKSKVERENTVMEMKNKVSELLTEHGIRHEIKGRAKSIYSIYKKLDRGKKFNEIYDLHALRVYVETEAECYQVLGIIHSKYRPLPNRFKDYIAMPKTNMYQSLHTTVFGIEGILFEIQIRTYEMDRVAEHGIAAHWSYKEKGSIKATLQNEMEQKLQFFRSVIELKDAQPDNEELVKTVQEDVFDENVYVFTPLGDVIELPKGSTPIDFAYRVHSRVGDTMVGAIVNGNIVPLDYVLKDNDIVKINTNKNSLGPSKEWINMAYTSQAKSKIKAFFNRIDKNEYLKTGQELLLKELRRKKIAYNDFLNTKNINKILTELKCSSMDDVYIGIGNNKYPINQIINIITNDNTTKEEIILKKAQNNDITIPKVKNDIIIEGLDDVKVNLALCCKPIPGDHIIGYITKGNGISVHRSVCPNVSNLEERVIDVDWNTNIHKKYSASILVHSLDNKNVLLDIIAKTSNSDIVIQSINSISARDNFLYEITVLVENKEKLEKFMSDIKSIDSVLDVERYIK